MRTPPVDAAPPSLRRQIGTALVLGFFTVAGLWLLGIVIADLLDYRSAAGWPPVTAEVVRAEIEELPGAVDGADGFGVVLRYRYEVGGRAYESDRLRREGAERFTTREAAQEVLDGYLPGGARAVTARYDPADPATAVLSPSPPVYLLLFVAAYWLVLLAFLIPAIRNWRALRRAQA